jgi:hypothetical protein
MRTRIANGLTEIIPSVEEKRDDLLRRNALALLENIHQRLERIEETLLVTPDEQAAGLLVSMRRDLVDTETANAILDTLGEPPE